MLIRRTLFLLAASAAWAAAAQAHDYKLGDIEISHPWARATPPGAPTGGGFLKLTNNGKLSDRFVGARSAMAEAVQIHESRMEGNIMRMRELDHGLEIQAGASVTLAPGSYHLMLIGLKSPLKEGTRVPLTLIFEKAGSIDVELAVVAMGATPGGHTH